MLLEIGFPRLFRPSLPSCHSVSVRITQEPQLRKKSVLNSGLVITRGTKAEVQGGGAFWCGFISFGQGAASEFNPQTPRGSKSVAQTDLESASNSSSQSSCHNSPVLALQAYSIIPGFFYPEPAHLQSRPRSRPAARAEGRRGPGRSRSPAAALAPWSGSVRPD